MARTTNEDGVEVGRSRKWVVMEKDDANYIQFTFDEQMDTTMVRRYQIGL